MSTSTSIQAAVQRYLDERRSLGFELGIAGGQLLRFGRFADARAHRGPLSLDLQFAWAREHVRRTTSITAARRLEVLRPFVKHYRQFEPDSVVPDLSALGRGHRSLASGSSIDQGMFLLCTYLGHAKISDTYWYLSGVPDLIDVIGARFERFASGQEVDHA